MLTFHTHTRAYIHAHTYKKMVDILQQNINFNTHVLNFYFNLHNLEGNDGNDGKNLEDNEADILDTYTVIKILNMIHLTSTRYQIKDDDDEEEEEEEEEEEDNTPQLLRKKQELREMLHRAPQLLQKHKTEIYLDNRNDFLTRDFKDKLNYFNDSESTINRIYNERDRKDKYNTLSYIDKNNYLFFDIDTSLCLNFCTRYDCTNEWKYPFNVTNTGYRSFYPQQNTEALVETMMAENTTVGILYCEVSKCLFVRLPYNDTNNGKMLIAMPDEQQNKKELLRNFWTYLDGRTIYRCMNSLRESEISQLYIPTLNICSMWKIYHDDDDNGDMGRYKYKNDNRFLQIPLTVKNKFSNIYMHFPSTHPKKKTLIYSTDAIRSYDSRCYDAECVSCKPMSRCCRCDAFRASSETMNVNSLVSLHINKPFLFLILDERDLVAKVGVYYP